MSYEALHRRARRVRSRAQVRRWEFRQRDLSKGTWLRLARLLADARLAFVVSEEDSAALEREGIPAEPVGAELSPPKLIRRAPEARVRALESRREVPLRLGPDLLAARHIVLCPFEHESLEPS